MSSVKKNFIYNTAYQILILVLPLITTPYLTRVLGADGIGIYSYNFSIAKYFVLFALLGLSNYGNRSIAEVSNNREALSIRFSEIYGMQLITSVVVSVIYIGYAVFFSKEKMAIILIVYVLYSVIDVNWFFFGIQQFKLTVIRNTIIKLLSIASIFIFVKSPEDVYIYGLILALSFLISQISILPFLRRYIDLRLPTIAGITSHFKQNLILFIPVIAVSLYKMMDKIMLGLISNMESVGYYESAESVINIPIALVQSLGTVMLPKMASLAANHKTEESSRYIKTSLVFAIFLASSLSFGIMAVSHEFVPAFFGDGFEICINLFAVLAPSCIFMAIANVARTQYLIPLHKDTIYIRSVFLGAITNLIINALLIPSLDCVGAAIGTLIAEGSVCIYQIIATRKELKIGKTLILSIPFFISGVVMYLIDVSINLDLYIWAEIMLKVLIGAFAYLFVTWILYMITFRVFNVNSENRYVNRILMLK